MLLLKKFFLSDAYRKLAKLCAKTSIVDNPQKLPEEALGFVTRGERAYTRRETRGPPMDEDRRHDDQHRSGQLPPKR